MQTHEAIAATDSSIVLALDRDSVRGKDQDGRMVVAVTNISKATVNPYKGSEIPGWEELGLEPNKIYQMLRDPEELRKAAPSFNGVQLLRKHTPVSSDDHRPYDVVGTTGTGAVFEDPYLRNSLHVWSQEAIDDIESEDKKELSCGYHYRPEMTPGNFGGMPYDGVMRDIVGNHVALVKDGRAGPDVVVGDSTENLPMTKPTRLANVALQFTARSLKPLLAKDAKIDLMPIFKDITTKNFDAKKLTLALDEAVKGHLAKDASLKQVTDMLDALGGTEAEADLPVSEEQNKGMMDAATVEPLPEIIPAAKDAGPEALRGFLKEKGLGEDDIKQACDMVGMKENALDADPDKDKKDDKAEDEKTEEEIAAEKKAAEDAKTAKDAMKDMVTKPAMDAAIKAVANTVRETERGIRIALSEVRPYVGELPATLAFDSGADVKRHALVMLGVDNAKTLHADALDAVLAVQRKAGARPTIPEGGEMAFDAAQVKSFAERYPGSERIGTA